MGPDSLLLLLLLQLLLQLPPHEERLQTERPHLMLRNANTKESHTRRWGRSASEGNHCTISTPATAAAGAGGIDHRSNRRPSGTGQNTRKIRMVHWSPFIYFNSSWNYVQVAEGCSSMRGRLCYYCYCTKPTEQQRLILVHALHASTLFGCLLVISLRYYRRASGRKGEV